MVSMLCCRNTIDLEIFVGILDHKNIFTRKIKTRKFITQKFPDLRYVSIGKTLEKRGSLNPEGRAYISTSMIMTSSLRRTSFQVV